MRQLYTLVLANLASLFNDSSSDNEHGQTLIEYGLIVALISIVAIVALTLVGGNISNVFNSIAGKLHS